MAVEDGAVLGYLLGQVVQKSAGADTGASEGHVTAALALYEKLRKSRTTTNVLGAIDNRKHFHMHDGEEQAERDAVLADFDWYNGRAKWKWIDIEYQKDLVGFDALKDAENVFEKWWEEREGGKNGMKHEA